MSGMLKDFSLFPVYRLVLTCRTPCYKDTRFHFMYTISVIYPRITPFSQSFWPYFISLYLVVVDEIFRPSMATRGFSLSKRTTEQTHGLSHHLNPASHNNPVCSLSRGFEENIYCAPHCMCASTSRSDGCMKQASDVYEAELIHGVGRVHKWILHV